MNFKTKYPLLAALILGSITSANATQFLFTFVDEENVFAQRGWLDGNSLFQRNFKAAGAILAALIESDQDIRVDVKPDLSMPRFSGGLNWGRQLRTENGLQIWEPSALTRILEGTSISDVDIVITVNPAFLDQWYWLDTEPESRTDMIEPGKTDLVSIVLHELMHGLGIASRRSFDPDHLGEYLADDTYRAPYDLLTRYADNGISINNGVLNTLQFIGPESNMVNNGALKLTFVNLDQSGSSQNFSHIGDCNDAEVYRSTLMNGCSVPTDGSRLKMSPYDLAMLADIGYPIRSVFFPEQGYLVTAATLNGSMYAALLQLVDVQIYQFKLAAVIPSNRPDSDAVYHASSGSLLMTNLVLNDTTERFTAEMTAVPDAQTVSHFKLNSLAVSPD